MGLSLREIFLEAKKVLTRGSLKVFKASHNTFFGRLARGRFFRLASRARAAVKADQAMALMCAFSRLLWRAAVFAWIKPLPAALSMRGTASL